jgi:ABC-2 type transport system permease protein
MTNVLRIYELETKFEFLKQLRRPAYAIATLGIPVMFYAFFGLMSGLHNNGLSVATYLLATYGTFGVVGAAMFGFGVSVSMERGARWLLLKRASPMPPLAYFVAKIITATAFAGLVVALLFAMGALFGGVRLPALTWLELGAALVVGALPFCAIGLALGYLISPNSAVAVINLVNLPMSFLSGLWLPINILPPIAQHIAPFLPAYHLAQLALGTLGAATSPLPWYDHVLILLAFTSGALTLAAVAYRQDEGQTYG